VTEGTKGNKVTKGNKGTKGSKLKLFKANLEPLLPLGFKLTNLKQSNILFSL
jgi:hypothetical protein